MKYLLIFSFVITGFYACSQNVDYNKIIIPEGTINISFEERLVQLAWKNHPSNQRVLENVTISKYHLKEERASWTNDIFVTGNVNEFTLNPNSDVLNRAQFFPKYNIGARLNLGTFILTPLRVKSARSQLYSSEHLVKEKKLEVRSTVLSSLEKFKESYKVLKLRKQLLEDVLLVYQDVEKQFQQGKVGIDVYQTASQAYSLRAESVIFAQSSLNQNKLAVEELIGLKLEDVSGYDSFINALDISEH